MARSTAGLFLKEFVGDTPWVHIDLAGPAMADADDSYVSRGGTGFGVRTLVELLDRFSKPVSPRRRRSRRRNAPPRCP